MRVHTQAKEGRKEEGRDNMQVTMYRHGRCMACVMSCLHSQACCCIMGNMPWANVDKAGLSGQRHKHAKFGYGGGSQPTWMQSVREPCCPPRRQAGTASGSPR